MINKNFLEALLTKIRCESYECGYYGNVKNQYRIIFCKDAEEYTTQRKFKEGWLCLHN